MKVRLYAGDMNINRKDEKNMQKYKKKIFFRKQNGENFAFSSPNVYSSIGYLASITF